MERSDKDASRIDQELKRELTSIAQGAPVEARSELARRLPPSIFPADRAGLVESARRAGAPTQLIAQLERLPEGPFDHLEAVWEALGGRAEYRA
jgi:hypothetical protein